MELIIGSHGKGPSASITRSRREERAVDEFLGICRGVLADGAVNVSEARFLGDWIARHSEFSKSRFFEDVLQQMSGIVSSSADNAESLLLTYLSKLVGGETHDVCGSNSLACALPFCEPPPVIRYGLERVFVATGTFAFGKRQAVQAAIIARGGEVRDNMTKTVNYLIVGEVGSRDWAHSSFGRKIEQAVEWKAKGEDVSIVSEQHWAASLI